MYLQPGLTVWRMSQGYVAPHCLIDLPYVVFDVTCSMPPIILSPFGSPDSNRSMDVERNDRAAVLHINV